MNRKSTWVVACALTVMVAPRGAGAQGSARSLDIDASIRSAGTGGACNAVFWGDDPNEWANPALLGYQRGIRFSYGRTRLVPGLADNVYFKTERLKLGVGGVGALLPGDPNGFGSGLLDYGLQESIDEQGNPTGTFGAYEKIRAWGIGVSLSELIGSAAEITGHDRPGFLRFGDIAAGYTQKHVLVHLAPASAFGEAETDARDLGILVRATPIDGLDSESRMPLPLRVDLSYGYSVLNYDDGKLVFIGEDQPSPTTRNYRDGYAARLALGIPGRRLDRDGVGDWLARSLTPLVSIGYASDRERLQGGDDASGRFEVRRSGAELILANILSYRTGHVRDPLGDIDGDTDGFGLGFRFDDIAGFRYDWARIPQARGSGLRDVERRGFTAFIDPWALLHRMRRSGEGSL